jgi:hypothetical protein
VLFDVNYTALSANDQTWFQGNGINGIVAALTLQNSAYTSAFLLRNAVDGGYPRIIVNDTETSLCLILNTQVTSRRAARTHGAGAHVNAAAVHAAAEHIIANPIQVLAGVVSKGATSSVGPTATPTTAPTTAPTAAPSSSPSASTTGVPLTESPSQPPTTVSPTPSVSPTPAQDRVVGAGSSSDDSSKDVATAAVVVAVLATLIAAAIFAIMYSRRSNSAEVTTINRDHSAYMEHHKAHTAPGTWSPPLAAVRTSRPAWETDRNSQQSGNRNSRPEDLDTDSLEGRDSIALPSTHARDQEPALYTTPMGVPMNAVDHHLDTSLGTPLDEPANSHDFIVASPRSTSLSPRR